MEHQYILRESWQVRTEFLRADSIIGALYSDQLEDSSWLCRAISHRRTTAALSLLNYDKLIGARGTGTLRFLKQCGADLSECVRHPKELKSVREIFERQIRYWECRPLPDDEDCVVCPADARVLLGSLSRHSLVYVKGKFFELQELLGADRHDWSSQFEHSDFAVFRLTPDKYHYTHFPVSGRVVEHYAVDGSYHSCNPSAVVSLITPFSKNKRVVTIVDTDVPNGTRVGLVAMVEIVALMIGRIEQRYSEERYEDPRPVSPGMDVKRGAPKALFRPGSSTVVLLFQPTRVKFCNDLVTNQSRPNIRSRYSEGFGAPLVETDVRVRSALGSRFTLKTERTGPRPIELEVAR